MFTESLYEILFILHKGFWNGKVAGSPMRSGFEHCFELWFISGNEGSALQSKVELYHD